MTRLSDPLMDPENGHILTRAIIDTIREPLIILDDHLRVITASKSFYAKFKVEPADTQEKMFYDLGNGQWNIPQLRALLEKIIPEQTTVDEYLVEHTFPPPLGRRTMMINAREVRYENGRKKMLLAIFDVTKQRQLEAEREGLLLQKDLLLKEMRHRIANSLQLIASILILKAGTVESEETRKHLEDAHNRILSIATVQGQLDPLAMDGGEVAVSKYLKDLCASLARSMIGDRRPISLLVDAGPGMVNGDEAISLGLMTTELVINALKHAFPDTEKGKVTVTYLSNGSGWMLSIADDGIGRSKNAADNEPGLGSGIIAALAHQMKARIQTESTERGTTVSIVHSTTGIHPKSDISAQQSSNIMP